MKILTKEINKVFNTLKPFELSAFIVAFLIIIPISNFLFEGIDYFLGGNFSLGLAGREEILGRTFEILLPVLLITSFEPKKIEPIPIADVKKIKINPIKKEENQTC